jgi:hypothetical protein
VDDQIREWLDRETARRERDRNTLRALTAAGVTLPPRPRPATSSDPRLIPTIGRGSPGHIPGTRP